jgi:pilus assembly protein Flp/PilA
MLGQFARRAVEFLKQEDGPTAVEYAVMLALIVVVCIVAITAIGTNANSTFRNTSLNAAVGGS